MNIPGWIWAPTLVLYAVLFIVDLLVVGRRPHVPTTGECLRWLSLYIGLGVAFGAALWAFAGRQHGVEFFAGWITEYSLSVDNLFVFLLIMARFYVPRELQQSVLMWGIVIALILRAIFIALGAAVIERYSWVFYVFGAFLIYTAIKLASTGETDDDEYHENAVVRWVARILPSTPDFHGTVHDLPAHVWSVSAIETYLDCPFKFFAQHVLKLEEEPEDEEVMDPRRQGKFVHDVFERFFAAWQNAGHRAVTPDNLDAAREMFTAVVDRALDRLPIAEAGLERTRLLGSPAAAGLGEAVLRMEAERPLAVVERLLEHPLKGDFTFATADGPRTIALRGKADRLDLLADGTFRLIDYKLGWPPNRTRALQLPIYSLCAEQRLAGHKGKTWQLREAAYLAFKGPKRVVPLFSSPADRAGVLADAQQRLADTVDAIERGDFPPTPDDVYRCETCSFASVCRKDYVGDV